MIIDLILDRKDGFNYSPSDFYRKVNGYYPVFPELAAPILDAMNEGEEPDVKNALCDYIDNNDYNPDIKNFILSNYWL